MVFKCAKCNANFMSEYHLKTHLNKTTPCDEVISCKKCDKVFDTNKDLKKHLAKKIPCKTPVEIIAELKQKIALYEERDQLKIELEKEKTLRIEKEIQAKKDLALIQMESDRLAEEAIRKENEAKREADRLAKEEAFNRAKELELIKNQRKYITYINNGTINNINDNNANSSLENSFAAMRYITAQQNTRNVIDSTS